MQQTSCGYIHENISPILRCPPTPINIYLFTHSFSNSWYKSPFFLVVEYVSIFFKCPNSWIFVAYMKIPCVEMSRLFSWDILVTHIRFVQPLEPVQYDEILWIIIGLFGHKKTAKESLLHMTDEFKLIKSQKIMTTMKNTKPFSDY